MKIVLKLFNIRCKNDIEDNKQIYQDDSGMQFPIESILSSMVFTETRRQRGSCVIDFGIFLTHKTLGFSSNNRSFLRRLHSLRHFCEHCCSLQAVRLFHCPGKKTFYFYQILLIYLIFGL